MKYLLTKNDCFVTFIFLFRIITHKQKNMLSIEELKKIQKGQWIFTCSNKPLQFSHFHEEKNPNDYKRSAFTDERWEQFSKYDDFETMEGSNHSVKNCSLKLISESYAKWFIENKCWEIYDKIMDDLKEHEEIEETELNNRWTKYEDEISKMCLKYGITYEGF